MLEGDDEGGEVEGDVGGAGVSFPDEEGLGGIGFMLLLGFGFGFGIGGVSEDGVFEAGGEAGVDFVVPAAADGPAGFAVSGHDLSGDLVGGRGFPAAGFEVEGADFAGGVVFDLHGAIVVNGGGAGDDADDGGGDFFPGVKLFTTSGWAEFEEPGAEGVDVEGLAVEFGFYC